MKLHKAIMRRVIFAIVIMAVVTFSLSPLLAHAGEIADIINDREDILKRSIPIFSAKNLEIDRNHKPSDLSKVSWICFKKNHLFAGYDRSENILFNLFPCATGRNTGQKQKEGDMRTPEGNFRVQQIQEVSWWPPYTDSKTGEKIGYGPYFIRIDTGRWKGIGIHGTDVDHVEEIGTNASHGCIRLENRDLLEVVGNSETGQQVLILP